MGFTSMSLADMDKKTGSRLGIVLNGFNVFEYTGQKDYLRSLGIDRTSFVVYHDDTMEDFVVFSATPKLVNDQAL